MKPISFHHLPVLRDEVMAALRPVLGSGRVAVDCTLGAGGHTEALLDTGSQVIAVDRDEAALAAVRARLFDRAGLTLVHGDFRDLGRILSERKLGPVDALLADLGVSSPQLDEPARGFSFRQKGPLDMRMDPTSGASLLDRLGSVEERELTAVLRDFGEERRAPAVARAILRALREGGLTDTLALAETVSAAVGRGSGRTRKFIHPATRTFQALRIWVNDELGALDALLAAIPQVLALGGRAALISFHSLEDRRVKRAFAELSKGCVCPRDIPVCACKREAQFALVTRRAVGATDAEAEANPRARSAKLRVIRRRDRIELGASNQDEEVGNG